MIRGLYLLPILLSVAFYCRAGAFEEGGAAYMAGNYKLAAKKFMEVADKNDHRAMYALGSMYAAGRGVPRDYRKAFELFSRAARYGRVDARYKLGIMYQEGLGVARSDRRAARSFHDAAIKGYGPAQFQLGMCYANGRGVKQDLILAGTWLTVADASLEKRPLVPAQTPDTDSGGPKAMQMLDSGVVKQQLHKILARLSPEQQKSVAQRAREYMH